MQPLLGKITLIDLSYNILIAPCLEEVKELVEFEGGLGAGFAVEVGQEGEEDFGQVGQVPVEVILYGV